jgi:hypothetical protein
LTKGEKRPVPVTNFQGDRIDERAPSGFREHPVAVLLSLRVQSL